MTGIGKTSLVKQVYDDPVVAQQFEHQLFLSIGPRFQRDEIVLLARRQFGIHSDDDKVVYHESEDEDEDEADYHVDQLIQFLLGTKYLIVLDGVWNHWTWNELKHVFPNNGKGSRIIVTTQMLSLVFDSAYDTLKIRFLDDDESWKLLRETVFGTNEEKCDPKLEKVGKKIAKKCEGLPLAIIQVGELLRATEKTVEKWEEIAKNEDPFNITRSDNTPLSNALSLSYTMLPQYLKVCLLYTSAFPKHYEIRRNKLIQLWLSEGLVEQQLYERFEVIAAEYLWKLIHQSVVLSTKARSIDTDAAKTCRLHFIFRSLSVSEAEGEKFFHVIKSYADSFPENTASHQRLCIHNNVVLAFKQVHEWMETIPNTRSLLCYGPKQQHPIALYLRFRLLKVLDALAIRFYEFPDQVLQLFHLRYLAITYDRDELPASISCLWNLRYLIVHRHHNIKKSLDAHVYLPMEIWKLHNLKHLECMGFDLPDPSSSPATAEDDSLILEELVTLLGVSPTSCTEGVLARIPCLAKIGILIESAHDSLETFTFFGDQFASRYEKFESFKCVVVNPNLSGSTNQVVPSSIPINFPEYITKITLSGCGFPWEYTRVIARLPNLEVLKLRWYAFCGPEWKTHEAGEFRHLKYLMLEDLDLERCIVGSHENFPWLRSLVIRHCYNLREMSSHFGGVEMIEMEDCSPFAMVWAAKIRQERLLEVGPAGTQLHLHSSWDEKPRRS